MATSDWKSDRVRSALNGTNPTVMAKLAHAFAFIGDTQFLRGYSLALTKVPGADRLSDLSRPERVGFLSDVDLEASAGETACAQPDSGFRRASVG